MGAANVAAFPLLTAFGLDPAGIVACDSRGTLHNLRTDIAHARDEFREQWHICQHTSPGAIRGGIREARRGADVAIAFSAPRPGLISRAAVRGMAQDPIVFACAHPEPESDRGTLRRPAPPSLQPDAATSPISSTTLVASQECSEQCSMFKPAP